MKNSKSATKRMKKRVKGVLNACKAILNKSENNGYVINKNDKKLAALKSKK